MTAVNRLAFQLRVSGELAKSAALGAMNLGYNIERGIALVSGVAAGAVDTVYASSRQIAASGSEDLDLAGALADPFGIASTAVFAKIRGILISAAPGNVNNVVIGGVTNGLASFLTPAASGLLTLRPGAAFMLTAGAADAAGYAVVAATADLLHVANSAGGSAVNYDVFVAGTAS